MSSNVETNVRPNPDELLTKISDYVHDFDVSSQEALSTAKYCLMDTIKNFTLINIYLTF